MPTTAKYRRTWFALLRQAGVADEDRHWVQESITGKGSTRDWDEADWRAAIAALQRDLDQHDDRHPHVREDAPRRAADDDYASRRQCDLIEQLCGEIDWHIGERGPLAYLCASSLSSPRAALRRELMTGAWREGARGRALWRKLTTREASNYIRALRALKIRSPGEST